MSKRVLVTGAAGYLGSIMCEHLLDRGYHVQGVDNMMYGVSSLFHLCANPRFGFERGDARDRALMTRLVAEAVVIVPLAAIVGAPACDRDPLMASSINLGHSLGLRIVAEGVETAEVLDQLVRFGCDVAQGYFLSRPVPAGELERWLDDRVAAGLVAAGIE